MAKKDKNKLFKLTQWGLVVYGGIGVLLFLLQDFFLFHPVKLAKKYRYRFTVPFEETDILFQGTHTINMVKFFSGNEVPKGIVIYFHGNRGNINRYAKFANNFTKHGYEVWMADYPGFGKSIGVRNENILYRQAEQIYALAAERFTDSKIILFGKSFGTGIAAYLASVRNCRQLILETPYFNIPDLAGYYAPVYPAVMTHYKIYTNLYLKKVKAPVTIFHGTDDGIIPYRSAAKLKALLKPADQFITIKNGAHHNLHGFDLYHQKLQELLNR